MGAQAKRHIDPVFIAGCDRSGTTMLGDMLGAHSSAFVTPESQFFYPLINEQLLGRFRPSETISADLVQDFRFLTWGLPADRRRLDSILDEESTAAIVVKIAEWYAESNGVQLASARYWVDHTPDNLRYWPFWASHFPTAKFIHIVRDGRAVYSSIRHLSWGPSTPFYGAVFWCERIERGLLMETMLAERCLRLRYEDIVSRPRLALEKICRHLGIAFEPAMEAGGALKLPSFTRKQHAAVGAGLDPTRMDRWKQELSDQDLKYFHSCRDSIKFLRALGYDVQVPSQFATTLGLVGQHLLENLLSLRKKAIEKSVSKRECAQYRALWSVND